jgi:hypothetical protein
MRKLAFLVATLLLAFATAANATFCVDFDDFSDGISVTIGTEGLISAVWENVEGTGGEAPMLGYTEAGGGANVLVCSDPACPFGIEYAFFIAYPVSAFWAYDLTRGFLIVGESPFSVYRGACPFQPEVDRAPLLGW